MSMADAQRFSCPYCNRTFTTLNGLQAHQSAKKHLGQTINGGGGLERFTTKDGLKQHQSTFQVHSVCADCDYHCKSKNELKQHLASTEHSPRYCCDSCGKTYLEEEVLKEHLRSKSHQTKIQKQENPQLVGFSACANCNYQCRKRSTLKRHLDSTGHSAKFECRICGGTCLSEDDYVEHMKEEENKNRKVLSLSCANCNQRFKNQTLFEAHISSSGHVARYRCDVCNIIFMQQNTLQHHMSGKRHQRQIRAVGCRPLTGSSVWKNCGFSCGTEMALRQNLGSVRHYGKFECKKCEEIFVDEESHARHLKSKAHIRRKAEGPSWYDRDKGFPSRKDFLRHLDFLEHVPNYRYLKMDLGRVVLGNNHSSESYGIEIRQHENQRFVVKFSVCADCNYHCETKDALGQHLAFTKHCPRYRCEPCCKLYLGMEGLEMHLRSESHRMKIQQEETLRPGCANCNQRFTQQHLFEAHLRSSGHVARHRCDLCGMIFIQQNALQVHISGKKHLHKVRAVTHNPLTRYSICEDCDFWCDNEMALRRHAKFIGHYAKFECKTRAEICADGESYTKHPEFEKHIHRKVEGPSYYDYDRGFPSQDDFFRHLDFFPHVVRPRCDRYDQVFIRQGNLESRICRKKHRGRIGEIWQ